MVRIIKIRETTLLDTPFFTGDKKVSLIYIWPDSHTFLAQMQTVHLVLIALTGAVVSLTLIVNSEL